MSDPAIVIRDLSGPDEMRLIESLEREVWGLPDLDVVPLTQLVAAKAAGGIVVGAFDNDVLVGFAYGFVGLEEGQITHHSHMLAVKPEYRGHNVGYLLKLAQRSRALEQGIGKMTWTFDPLQSVNAYFNITKLGVISDRYFVNFYGDDAASFLHQGATDRLWVTWPLMSSRVTERIAGTFETGRVQVEPLLGMGTNRAPERCTSAEHLSGDRMGIEIPDDIMELRRQEPDLADEWRRATRWAFTEAFAAGYTVDRFDRELRDDGAVGRYVLVRMRDRNI